jgi:predicted DNA binding protein
MSWPRLDRDHRRKVRGESHHKSKLTDDDVRLIRSAYASGGITQRALAEKFGVVQRAIAQVIHYESWRHVP